MQVFGCEEAESKGPVHSVIHSLYQAVLVQIFIQLMSFQKEMF